MREYRFFCYQSQKMIELQQEYRSYIDQIKRQFKKNKSLPVASQSSAFLEVGRIVSSKGDDSSEDPARRIVNRCVQYLTASMLSYLQEQKEHYTWHEDDIAWLTNSDELFISAVHDEPVMHAQPISVISHGPSIEPKNNPNALFIWPINRDNFWLSSCFGPRKRPNGVWGFHYGIDMAALRGTSVAAAAHGTVIEAGWASGYGNTIVIAHSAMYKTRYAHLDSIVVTQNQHVKQGEKIGTVGDTGFTIKSGTDASHLHFEVYERGKQVNPLPHLHA